LRGHHPRCRQVERNNPDLPSVKFASQPLPVGVRQAAEPVNLLNEQDITRPGVSEQPEEFGPGEFAAGLILDIPAGDAQTALSGEGLLASTRCVLFGGGSSEVSTCEHVTTESKSDGLII
jgi:hypothetical protein